MAVEQVEAVIGALPQRYRALGVVAAGCGLRQGEAFGVRVRDVDFLTPTGPRRPAGQDRRRRITIGAPKGGKTRSVPLHCDRHVLGVEQRQDAFEVERQWISAASGFGHFRYRCWPMAFLRRR